MWKQIQCLALSFAVLGVVAGAAVAAEMPEKPKNTSGLPKGSYGTSCTCQVSGGVQLLCFCNNLQAKMFETTMDLRTCPAPKDIKNCDGKLTCTEGQSAQCPGK